MGIANDYDHVAVERAKKLQDKTLLEHSHLEKPAMYGLLPEVSDKEVLCVGCGTGEECGEIVSRGGKVTGIDNSEVSIAYAKENIPGCNFIVADMDSYEFPVEKYDFIYSSLAFHYSNNLQKLFNNLYKALKPQGEMLFSVGHPVKWSAEAIRDPNDDNKKSFLLGYEMDGDKIRMYGDYLNTHRKSQKVAGGPVLNYWTRPIGEYTGMLKKAGFVLEDFIEPSPIEEVKDLNPGYWERYSKIPFLMIFRLGKIDLVADDDANYEGHSGK